MNSREFLAARERAGLSQEAAAAEFNVTPAVVAGWESGSVSIPRRYAQEMTWRAAVAERQAALAASGLPRCGWVAAWENEPTPGSARKRVKHLEALEAHAASCSVCRAREEFIVRAFPPMPPRPLPAWMAVLVWIQHRVVGPLPAWLQPMAIGALIFLALTAFRVVLLAPQWLRTPGGWMTAGEGLVAGAAVGAGLGALVSAVRAVRAAWQRRRTA
jgi:transcriptional regulator with XRE-family HTH domain